MNSKIMIIRIRDTLARPIHYLEKSLHGQEFQYYSITEQDREAAGAHNGLECTVAFVVFEKVEPVQKDKIVKIYIGEGNIERNAAGYWVVNYKIAQCFSSAMFINNFVSNSELDLRHDFESQSHLNIEDNADLVRQVTFVAYPPYSVSAEDNTPATYIAIPQENGLHSYSQCNQHCQRVYGLQAVKENRSEFQRDYDRIVHAKAFRRLVDKAQIFTSTKGDHYRTRMTHTLEVAQIARSIAIGLNLNVTLTEAIALAHDLGHTPFGHQGERTLDAILKGKIDVIRHTPAGEKNYYGGFKHNFQGLRVASVLEGQYIEHSGLDLSYQVLEGILKHTSSKIKDCNACDAGDSCKRKCFSIEEFLPNGAKERLYLEYATPTTLEGQIVAIADEIAQRSHDLDDSFSSGILSVEQLQGYLSLNKMEALRTPLKDLDEQMEGMKAKGKVFVDEEALHQSRIVSEVVNFFIANVIEQSQKRMADFDEQQNDMYNQHHRFDEQLVEFSRDAKVLCDYLDKIISKKVISSAEVVRFDSKASKVVRELFQAYYENPKLLHKGTLRKIHIEMRNITSEVIDFLEGDLDEARDEINRIVADDFQEMDEDKKVEYLAKKKVLARAIADYIAGMTDSYALNEHAALYR